MVVLDDFSSVHPHGANILFADGSVRFVQSITADYYGPTHLGWMALGTRAGDDMTNGVGE